MEFESTHYTKPNTPHRKIFGYLHESPAEAIKSFTYATIKDYELHGDNRLTGSVTPNGFGLTTKYEVFRQENPPTFADSIDTTLHDFRYADKPSEVRPRQIEPDRPGFKKLPMTLSFGKK